ncbi:MAG: CotH kinase family protein [Deltaproteobacteria bacterium]|nr:CotH kinase family protein [Deltaproteobacteria bacterium]
MKSRIITTTVAVLAMSMLAGCLRTETDPSPSHINPNAPIVPLEDDREVYDNEVPGVLNLYVEVLPGGATIEEVDDDTDWTDDSIPEANVRVSEDGYTFGNGSTSSDAKLRQRGHSARSAAQKSYRIRFDDESTEWRDLNTLELNKHPYDLSRMRQKLSFTYFQSISDFTSLITQFIHLYIDGTDYGLYTLIERCNEEFLQRHGLDEEGHLYKAEDFAFYRYPDNIMDPSDPNYSLEKFEEVLEIRGYDGNHEKLINMLDEVNDEEIDINTVIEDNFQRDNYLTWFAINILLQNYDTNSQNFYLYSPTNSDGWYFLPWDYDGAWDFYGQAQEAAANTRPRWTQGVSNWWNVVLHKRFLKDPDNVQALSDKVAELLNVFTDVETTQLVEILSGWIFDIVTAEPDITDLPTIADDIDDKIDEYVDELDRLPGIPAESYDIYADTLDRPMPVWLGDPIQGDGVIAFNWDESYDLQGDAFTYDFQVSTDPSFADADIIYESLDRESNEIEGASLDSGTYYFRVIIRGVDDPDNNWQIAFDQYEAGDNYYYGVKQFVVE